MENQTTPDCVIVVENLLDGNLSDMIDAVVKHYGGELDLAIGVVDVDSWLLLFRDRLC